jgi:membrane protease YdiL (CAAX protease family)
LLVWFASKWSTITPLTLPIILTVVSLNSIGGLVFGYLYFENGLATAMLAHFVADLILHVLGPQLLIA